MSIFGHFKIKVKTPNGDIESDLNLEGHGDHLEGTQSAQGETVHIEHGAVHGDSFSFTSDVTHPAPMTLEFEGHCDDSHCDVIHGTVHAGDRGTFPFTGHRA